MRAALASLALIAAACASAPKDVASPAEAGPRVEIELAGADSLPEADVRAAAESELEAVERRASIRAAIDDAAFAVELLYESLGFAECEVEDEVLVEEADLVRARFVVREGPRTALDLLRIEGVRSFAEATLLALVDPEREFTGGWYVARKLDRAARAIADWYAAQGFLDAEVGEPEIELDPSRTHARATIAVREGPRYVLASVPRIEGGLRAIDDELDLRGEVGTPYSRRLAQRIAGRISEAYAAHGYPDAAVEVAEELLERNGDVTLAFGVDAGERVTIASVVVRGNAKTRTSRILGWCDLAPGDVYDLRKERTTFRALYRTGIFSKVKVALEPGPGAARRLAIEVEEAPSIELYIEPGYGSYEGPRALAGLRERNLFGSGRLFEVEGLAAELAERVSAALTEPRLFDTEVAATLSIFRERREEPSFTSDKVGSGLALRRDFGEDAEAALEYRLRRSQISDADVQDPLAQAAIADVDISSVVASAALDTRDSAFVPRSGSLTQASVEVADPALGSELGFVRLRLSYARFIDLRAGTVLGLSARTGAILPTGASTIPLQERFFNGGESTVRSFREGELGPRDSTGAPLGGEAFDVVSVELRQRLWGNFDGALFYDGGNVASDVSDYVDLPGFRHALGLGLRYRLPIGPVRVDAGFNPDPRADEDDYAVHFSIGLSF